MSKSALRDLNAVALSERRSNSAKKNSMKVLLQIDSNDENHAAVNHDAKRANKSENQGNFQDAKRLNRKPLASRTCSLSAVTEIDAAAATEVLGQEIEYISSEELKPLKDSEDVLSTLLERLDAKEWLTVWKALTHVRQLSIFNPSSMLPILNAVILLVIKAMKNPRSALCKTSIMASSDLVKAYTDTMLDDFDPLLLQLLLKASQDKKFVCEEAEKALIGMTTWISPVQLLEKLLPYARHKHPRVRAKAAICISNTVSKMGIQEIMDFGIEQLMQIAAAQLNDQLPEGREAARKLIIVLHAAYKKYISQNELVEGLEGEEDVWEQLCVSRLSHLHAQAILRVSCDVSL